jgi:protein gp37
MGIVTGIQWCDSTHNIQMGCEGCELIKGADIAAGTRKKTCYAESLTNRYAGLKGWPEKFTSPKLFLERLPAMLNWPDLTGKNRPDKPWLNEMPRIIFLNDMGDTFSKGMPDDWFADVLPELAKSHHQFLVLTKWPDRFARFSEKYALPPNVWPGTTITSERTAFRVNDLMKIEGGGPRFISFEPMWGPIFGGYWLEALTKVDWAIFGGESGSAAHICNMDWIIQGLDMYKGIAPVFVKQLGSKPYYFGEPYKTKDGHGGDWMEWPEMMRVREMPWKFQPKMFL